MEKTERKPNRSNEGRSHKRGESRPEKRSSGRLERHSEGRPERRSGDRPERRSGDRPERRSGDRPERRSEGRPERRSGDRPERRSEGRPERRSEGRPERSTEARTDKRPMGGDADANRPYQHKDSDEKITKATARMVAYRAIMKVFDYGSFVDVALESQKAYGLLSPQDRAFARWLTAGVVRYHRRLDTVVSQFWQKPPPFSIRLLLEMGALQLLLSDTPEHAAVSETVSLCGRRDEIYRGMVNGVLRNIIRENKIDIKSLDPFMETPKWLQISWEKYFGKGLAKKIAIANLQEADIDISLKKEDKAFLLELPKARPLPGGGARLREHKGRVNRVKGFKNGAFWVQDAAAQLPVKLLGDISGKKILDLCAAPGGKSLQMAALGADVTAIDLSENRMQRLRDNFERMDLPVKAITTDIFTWETEGQEQFDIVLLDAPCSATGTLRRHPEILRHRKAEDIYDLCQLQTPLLEKAKSYVKSDGLLVYVTCSLQPEEGVEQVNKFLQNNKEFKKLDLKEASQKLKIAEAYNEKTGYIQTHSALWDKIGGMDGFFIAILKRD